MSTLLINTKALATQMECDLEGRLEVMADDGLVGKPDYEDATAVAVLLRESYAGEYPVTLTLSDAEATQAYITLENMLDFEEASEADRDAAMDHLHLQGYPHGSSDTLETKNVNVFDYFEARFGREPSDQTLRELPVESNCGQDCKRAIDAAKIYFEEGIAKAWGHGVEYEAALEELNHVIGIFWRG